MRDQITVYRQQTISDGKGGKVLSDRQELYTALARVTALDPQRQIEGQKQVLTQLYAVELWARNVEHKAGDIVEWRGKQLVLQGPPITNGRRVLWKMTLSEA